jgi:hypothetical protein
MPALTLRPGVSIRLKSQPTHIPSFLVMGCQGDRAWIRQPQWPCHIQLCVPVTKIALLPPKIPPWSPGLGERD